MWGSASSAARHPGRVATLVRLRARRPDRWPTAAIEQLELNAGGVDGAAHHAAERVDFANQVALGGAADRGIAGHVGHGVASDSVTEPTRRAQTRCRPGRLDAGMAGADHDDVERSQIFALQITIYRYRNARRSPQHIVRRAGAGDLFEPRTCRRRIRRRRTSSAVHHHARPALTLARVRPRPWSAGPCAGRS